MGKVAEATEVIQLQKINWEPESNNISEKYDENINPINEKN